MMRAVIASPLFQLFGLGMLSLIVRWRFMRPGSSPTASGAIVMAVGIFGLGALRQILIPIQPILTQLLALELTVIWAFIAFSYLASWRRGTFHQHSRDPVNKFAIGTWVAGTSVLAQMIVLALPGWSPLAWSLGLIAGSLWLWYLTVVVTGFQEIAVDPVREHAKGRILLSTVSTQSIVILTVTLVPEQTSRWLGAALIALGTLFYVVGTTLITERYLGQRNWSLAEDWDNTNCILHGAMSITGLAAVVSGAVPRHWIIAIWLWVIVMFVLVESVELMRAYLRIKKYGWKQGVFTYHVSQWARNFTFGMLYAFTLHLYLTAPASKGAPALDAVWAFLVSWGQYIVLLLLLAETALFILKNIHFARQIEVVAGRGSAQRETPSRGRGSASGRPS